MKIKNLENIKDKFIKLSKNDKINNFYYDFNFVENSNFHIEVDKENVSINKHLDKGIKMRIFDFEKYLEFGTSNLDYNFLEDNFNKLILNAKENQKKIKTKTILNFDKQILEKDFNFEQEQENFSIKEKVEKLKKIKEEILNYSKDVINARVILISERENNCFVNKYKKLTQKINTNILLLVVFVKSEDSQIRYVYEIFCDSNFDIFKKQKKNLKKLFLKIENMKKAKKLTGGKYKVILSPRLSGLLAHESFGHGMEADTMFKKRALASLWQGKKIGKENINIVDYAKIKGKNGSYFFDNEGNLAQKTYLVKSGIINTPISDNFSNSHLNIKNSCNSRFESYDHKNYVRMSNTYFEAGEDNLDEMIKDVENGIFITDSNGGMEDPKNWSVQIQGCFGQKIENGKLVDKFYDGFTFTGFLPTIIKNILKVSNKIEIDGAGQCGKGHKEWVRVSEGGPYLLIDEVILG